MDELKERLQRRNDWYFRGWEWETLPGEKKKRWMYRGEYYAFPAETPLLWLRSLLGVSLAVLIISYLLTAFCPAAGNRNLLVSCSGFLGVIPLLYFAIGTFWTVVTLGPMTLRRYHSSIRRMRMFGPAGAAVMGITALGQIVVLASGGTNFWDWILLIASLNCVGQYLFCLYILRRHPIAAVSNT